MITVKWHGPDHWGSSSLWECQTDICADGGGHGGGTREANLRRTKRDARDHAEETGHDVIIRSIEGGFLCRHPFVSEQPDHVHRCEVCGKAIEPA